MDRSEIRREFLSKCAGWTEEDGLVKCYNSDLLLLYELYSAYLRDDTLIKLTNVTARYYGTANSDWAGMFRSRIAEDSKYYVEINPYPFIRMQRDALPFADIDGERVYNSLDAMLAVFEHELSHLLETLTFGKSAHGERFKRIAAYYFGHDMKAGVGHTLPTRNNLLRNTEGTVFTKGDKVRFQHSGVLLEGEVLSVRKNAKVQVSTPGKYSGVVFFVPTAMLQKADGDAQVCSDDVPAAGSDVLRNEAGEEFGAGDKVEFFHRHRLYHGVIVRVTKRATVRITAPEKYAGTRFYVPASKLIKPKGD